MTISQSGRARIARTARLAALVLGALAAGYLARWATERARPAPPAEAAPTGRPVQWWTCSMHPNVRKPGPGKCPFCPMDLVPVETAEETAGPRTFITTPAAKALMEIETSPVERRFVEATIRLTGRVRYDETRLAYITAWVPGRLDRLFVDYTGIQVNKGDHMVWLYSPDLLAAQAELRQALRAVRDLEASQVEIMKETARRTVEAVRDKLRLWGLTPEQVRDLEERDAPLDHLTIYAPIGGTVIQKAAVEGMYVETGTRIYTIADLSQVWVELDAYESDLVWLRYGQAVEFTTEVHPGRTFAGKIVFIPPMLDPRTRTVRVRVNVPNPDGALKTDVFVRAVARATVAAGGRPMAPDLAGKWMCPMHPEIVKDAKAACDICGMDLVTTESLGYVPAQAEPPEAPLVIPASAPLITGKRAVVYVEVPGRERPTYEGREIVLGPRAGDYYLVESGLKEGERVVTRGNFKIDSALQIQARPSMMSPEGGGAAPVHEHGHPAPSPPAAPGQ